MTFLKHHGLRIDQRSILLWITISVILFLVARVNYLFFHTVIEGFSIVVAAVIFILATATYHHSRNHLLLFMGIAYLFVGSIDFLHTLAYKGMSVFPNINANQPTQLWIAARYMEALSLLLALFFFRREFSRSFAYLAFSVITVLLVISIMVIPIFPACFVEGEGLTSFKIWSEYLISVLLGTGILVLYLNPKQINRTIYPVLSTSMAVTILSELSFTLYVDVYGFMNFLGHMLKFFSYYLIYRGILKVGIEAPHDLIFERLEKSIITDYLTGLYNRQGFMQFIDREIARANLEGNRLGILMMDLDNFKLVNDRYGHMEGDRVLKQFAGILKSSVRRGDVACRLGGDEFVVLVQGDRHNVDVVQRRITEAFDCWTQSEAKAEQLGVSIGISVWEPGQPEDVELLVREADRQMYRNKALKVGEHVPGT